VPFSLLRLLSYVCKVCEILVIIDLQYRTVEQGTRLEHHDLSGRLTVLNPGFHVRTPFIESFGQTIQMRDSTVFHKKKKFLLTHRLLYQV